MKYEEYAFATKIINILKFNQTLFTERELNGFLKELENDYQIRAKEYIANDENQYDLFPWLTQKMNIFVLLVSGMDKSPHILMFACKSTNKENKLFYYDYQQITDDIDFKHPTNLNPEEKLAYIQNKITINENVIKGVYKDSIQSLTIEGIEFFVYNWVNKTFNNSVASLSKPTFSNIDFNKVKLHINRYDFQSIVEDINNVQFTAELSECLYAYEHEKFFICAAGLGGVLEHIMYLTLEKNNMINKNFPDNPTYQDYVGALGRPPINIDRRQKNSIKSTFMIRNSISHFNSGFAAKIDCQRLMDGIKNIYSEYYIKEFTNVI